MERENEPRTKKREDNGNVEDVNGDLCHPDDGADHNENKKTKHHHKVLRKAQFGASASASASASA